MNCYTTDYFLKGAKGITKEDTPHIPYVPPFSISTNTYSITDPDPFAQSRSTYPLLTARSDKRILSNYSTLDRDLGTFTDSSWSKTDNCINQFRPLYKNPNSFKNVDDNIFLRSRKA